ncbi:MAG: hypothetical protein A3F72_04735 [Bacteroidetes bacterium RIFCSPLOWO2_12_FULL_35_15]|nr:MAG: hypothetical protein A3F72_04735 [Bacteroidetes bacterium RIFCSPLOWO2_12_FULL_35_15]
MKLIVISNPINLNNEHEILCSLFEAGLEYFHLRKPDLSKEELEQYILGISIQFRNRVVLHSHHQLALEYGLKGVHYSKRNSFNSMNKQFENLHQSISVHSLEEIKSVSANFQYAFLSPVFDSISKQDYKSTFDKIKLKTFLHQTDTKIEVIALGGINEQNIPLAIDLGFNGIATLGAIWMSSNPVKKYKHLLKAYTPVRVQNSAKGPFIL